MYEYMYACPYAFLMLHKNVYAYTINVLESTLNILEQRFFKNFRIVHLMRMRFQNSTSDENEVSE